MVQEELPHQRFGLGIQPWYLVTDAGLTADGDIDLSEVTLPTSANVKTAVASLMQSAVQPNWHTKSSTWEEAVKTNKWSKRVPEDRWPLPLEEDGVETETEEVSEEEG